MPSLHSQWLRIAEQLRDATTQLDLAVSVVLAKVAADINPKAAQLEAIRLARRRVDDVRALMDGFLDQHLP
jgi:hypothetical protein